MISDSIMIYTAGFKQVEDTTYDAIGCPTEITYSEAVTLPCYITETTYKEMIDGKQVNQNGYLLYINYVSSLESIDKTWIVEYNSKNYAIVNIDRTFDERHIEITLTDISND